MKTSILFLSLTLLINCFSVRAEDDRRQMEYLDRGLVAVKTDKGVFLSWRLLGTDDRNIEFNIYRNGTLVNPNPISGATNWSDAQGAESDTYIVKSLANGIEAEQSKEVKPWSQQFITIPLRKPSDGITPPYSISGESYPNGQAYVYTPNDCSVGDLDGDGEYEIILKWDPSNSRDNSLNGYTGNVYLDAYKIDGTFLWRIDLGKNIRAGAHYTQFLVYDLDGDGIAEIACKTAPGTIDGTGKYVVMNNDDPMVDYRNTNGRILAGPEYLTVFNGRTGAEITTIAYNPPRGTASGATWGDSSGNRVDRFLACIAYLDGIHPNLVMCRGYYTRSTLAAYDFKNGKLTERWFYDSGTIAGVGAYGQGNHNLAVGDVDNDGFDEIIYGAAAIDHNGKLLYTTGLGHGDAGHLSDLDPDRKGLEYYQVHEKYPNAAGVELRDAKTGGRLFGLATNSDIGRGLAADIDSKHRGFEFWSSANSNVYNIKGEVISTKKPSCNFRVYWDGDLQDELLDGTKIDKWTGNGTSRLITFYNFGNAKEINGTKANPCLSADILGDWREEVIYYDGADADKLLLFTSVIPTEHRLFTLMHDPVYRLSVAWQNVVYNQPPHLGFYIGDGLDDIPWPEINVAVYDPTSILTEKYDAPFCSVHKEAHDRIYVKSDEAIRTITLYSVLGKVIFHKCLKNDTEYRFTLPDSGDFFLIKVESKERVQTFKVM